MDWLAAYEMVGTNPVGGLLDKPKYLEYVKVNSLRTDSCEFKEGKVQVYGDAAVVTGLFRATSTQAVAVLRGEVYHDVDQAPRNLAVRRLAIARHRRSNRMVIRLVGRTHRAQGGCRLEPETGSFGKTLIRSSTTRSKTVPPPEMFPCSGLRRSGSHCECSSLAEQAVIHSSSLMNRFVN